jgi:sec-independent protein translocase protein TatC
MTAPIPDELVSQPLIDHLVELRRRLIWAFGLLLVAMIVSYVYAQPIYGFLVEPLARAMGPEGTNRLIYTNLTEAFMTYLKVAFFTGFYVTFPIILMQIWLFIAPGLYQHERRMFQAFFVATPVLFYLGGAMVYFVVLPVAWTFFLSFQSTGGETVLPIQLEARVGEYLDLVMLLVFAFGLAFELPILLMLLARANIITAQTLRKRRKYAIIIAFIVAAVLTPSPDVISQVCLAIPLLGLYEISILLIERFIRSAPPEPAPAG